LIVTVASPAQAGKDRRHGRGARTTRLRRTLRTFRPAASCLTPQRPSQPAPTFRDDRETSPLAGAGYRIRYSDLHKMSRDISRISEIFRIGGPLIRHARRPDAGANAAVERVEADRGSNSGTRGVCATAVDCFHARIERLQHARIIRSGRRGDFDSKSTHRASTSSASFLVLVVKCGTSNRLRRPREAVT
jgi:hypothetical protein